MSVRYAPDALTITIEDEGRGFDPDGALATHDPEALMASGRGIFIIRGYMDEVAWELGGRRIRMVKKLT